MEEKKEETLKSAPLSYRVSSWNTKIEQTIRLIERQCRLYKKMHNEVSMISYERYSNFMLMAIIISPLSGVISSIGTLFEDDLQSMYIYSITSTILSFLSGIIITIIKFNKYDEVSYSHKTASSRYISLEENIKRQLMLYREDRIDANEYLSWICKSFDELFLSSPNFETKIMKKYKQDIEKLEKEYDDIELNFNKPNGDEKQLLFLQFQDLNKYDDEFMKIQIKKV